MSTNSFKIFCGEEIRRITLPTTASWEDFLARIKEIFGPRFSHDLLFQYQDEEGDCITIGSEVEWREAIQVLQGDKIKKITVIEKKKCNKKKGQKMNKNKKPCKKSNPQQLEPSQCVSQLLQDIQNLIPQVIENITPLISQFQSSFGKPDCAFQQQFGNIFSQLGADSVLNNIQRFVGEEFDILEALNIVEESDVISFAKLVSELRMTFLQNVDISCILEQIHATALRLYDSKIKEARLLMILLCEIEPRNKYYVYNLACAESLLNNKDRAIQLLKKAVLECGYTNIDHIENDSDFNNIRSSSEFKSFVTSLRPAKVQVNEKELKHAAPPAPVPAPAPAPAPAPVPAPVPAPLSPYHSQQLILKEMGFLNEEQVSTVLIATNGDLTQAISVLLR